MVIVHTRLVILRANASKGDVPTDRSSKCHLSGINTVWGRTARCVSLPRQVEPSKKLPSKQEVHSLKRDTGLSLLQG